jgi:hypothetical protein
MSGTTWTKFYWPDWQSDPALRLCSYAARGLWMDMLCIAAAHDPIGYVAVAGRALDETDIARMTGGSESEVRALMGELDRNGVFSRDRQRRIYSRRMVNDARKAATARKNGKLGGNPTLGKQKENPAWDNPPDNGGLKPQEPRARSQKNISSAFDDFWRAYPLKKSKGDALKAFPKALELSGGLDALLAGIDAARRRSRQWREGFVPYPATWLRAQGWLDDHELPNLTVVRPPEARMIQG